MKCVRTATSAVLMTLALAGPALATTPTETVLYSFRGDKNGSDPYSILITDAKGALYGTTTGIHSETKNACGNAFELAPPKSNGKPWGYRILHAFIRTPNDGCKPVAGLVAGPGHELYGTTEDGGISNGGTVFVLTPPAPGSDNWTESIIYSFTAAQPVGALVRNQNGVLYGTTSTGGTGGNGSVFELAPPAQGQTIWTETTLYSFQGGADGDGPTAGVVEDATGALYGTTYYGGGGTLCRSGQGCGTVFELAPPAAGQTAWTETVLYAFTGGADGGNPWAGLLRDKNGVLYGTTVAGGDSNGDGTVFELSPPVAGQSAWTESVLHTFQGHEGDGAYPYGGLIFDARGAVYGTAEAGGTGCCGEVFKLTPPAAGQTDWTETALYNFPGGSDGAYPYGSLVRDTAKNLFGTTSGGGASGYGTVFEITP
jgi:uncharacterized repeat protein (TIGR03803 family)